MNITQQTHKWTTETDRQGFCPPNWGWLTHHATRGDATWRGHLGWPGGLQLLWLACFGFTYCTVRWYYRYCKMALPWHYATNNTFYIGLNIILLKRDSWKQVRKCDTGENRQMRQIREIKREGLEKWQRLIELSWVRCLTPLVTWPMNMTSSPTGVYPLASPRKTP